MTNKRLIIAVGVAGAVLAFLIGSAIQETKKEVVTVSKLLNEGAIRKNIRLGARVADVPIEYETTPKLELRFQVRDIVGADKAIPVVFYGPMPESLRNGRDVILEGRFDGAAFVAESLQTQCPSKYEPPKGPGET